MMRMSERLRRQKRKYKRSLARRGLRASGLTLGRDPKAQLSEIRLAPTDPRLLHSFMAAWYSHGWKQIKSSTSQIGQDLFVLMHSDFKQGGYFVEFGASDGTYLSNTLLLENNFNWTGIVAEPARCWHDALKTNRQCAIDLRCVWHTSGDRLEFAQTNEPGLSTLASFRNADHWAPLRENAETYTVETVSLLDLLKQHNAPRTIDYLSIDTEGSELDILKAFDFDQFDIRIITCEHNHSPQRAEIQSLLKSKGYVRAMPELSEWDDWFVKTGD